jgi:hypothetical protein
MATSGFAFRTAICALTFVDLRILRFGSGDATRFPVRLLILVPIRLHADDVRIGTCTIAVVSS